jgi:hypothetical protein
MHAGRRQPRLTQIAFTKKRFARIEPYRDSRNQLLEMVVVLTLRGDDADGATKMPVLRYFVFVGAALLALLFVVAGTFPALPTAPGVSSADAADAPMIRIHSDRKWPERVVFDTSVPTTVPATLVAAVPAPTQTAKNETGVAAPSDAADVGTKVTARDAFAQLTPSDLKKMNPKPRQKRKIAKRHVAPPQIQIAQRPLFGLFANNIW